MQPEERESLLNRLAEIADRAPAQDVVVSDEDLEAYRRGRLAETEARRVEQLLAAHPANRRRLMELAGLAPPVAPASVRRRLLERYGKPRSALPFRRPGRRRAWAAGLTAAAAVLALAVGWATLRQEISLPAYEVRIAALTERRGDTPAVTVAEAYATTQVQIDAAVAGRAVDGIEVALYRGRGGTVEQVAPDRITTDAVAAGPAGGGVTLRLARGAARFEAAAGELAGGETGDHELYVVIARQGDLPESITPGAGRDPAAALAGRGRRQVHRLTLRLLADPGRPPAADQP